MSLEDSAGKNKIIEYVNRIERGESKESIFDGLPEIFKKSIEDELKRRKSVFLKEDDDLVAYEEQTKIDDVRKRLGIEQPNPDNQEEFPEIVSMSVEDFAVWISQETKKRNIKLQEDVYEILNSRPEFRELKVRKAFGDSKQLMSLFNSLSDKIKNFKRDTEENMTVVEGAEYVAGQWDHYKINDEKLEDEKTFKGYITIDKDQVLDRFSTDIRKGIVKKLIEDGFKGQVKFPVLGSRALLAYDNIVLHGVDSGNVQKGIEIIQSFLQEQNINFEDPRYGVDSKNEKGEKQSYTQRVADLVRQSIQDPNFGLEEEILKLKE